MSSLSAWKVLKGAISPRKTNDAGTIQWACQNDHRAARAILGTMEGVNVGASIGYFEGARASCDCEILFNLEEGSDE